ncbi:MAG TPA: squalene/phytoene synthase family protein [Streptosporangiaceae bacterium]|nr:squalene/phytoene synthase family protein [Streptosporangiaceae bacterium]
MSTKALDTGVRAAYEHCEQVTKTEARNFSYGIALLPGDKRRALSAVYAYARRIDDIGDGDLPPADKLTALTAARGEIGSLIAGAAPPASDLVLVALADAAGRMPIPLAAFLELIEGCEADVRGTVYETFDDLEHYCRCVAGSIGRLSLGVFGVADPATAAPLADALGVALQLTNILRDIREDLGNDRVYLPAEDLEKFGCTLDPAQPPWWAIQPPGQQPPPGDPSAMERLIRFEADRARSWYATGLRLMPLLDWRSAACAGAMAGIYLRLLGHLAATPGVVLERRMSLPGQEKIMVAIRALAGRTPRPPAGVTPVDPPVLAAPQTAPRAAPQTASQATPTAPESGA